MLQRRKRKSLQMPESMRWSLHQEQHCLLFSTRSVSSLKENYLAASRQQQSRFFECHDLVGHTDSILAIRLWSLSSNSATKETHQTTASVHEMKTKHESYVNCVAISPDNSRIFSGGMDSKLFIHDAHSHTVMQYF